MLNYGKNQCRSNKTVILNGLTAKVADSWFLVCPKLILGLRPTNERRRYKISYWLGENLESALR